MSMFWLDVMVAGAYVALAMALGLGLWLGIWLVNLMRGKL